MRSIDAVVVKLSGGDFTLLADNAAFVRCEEEFNIPFKDIGSLVFGESFRIKKVCEVAAVLAQNGVTADVVLKAAPLPEDLAALRAGIEQALSNYLPPKSKKDDDDNVEGGGAIDPNRPLGNG